MRNIPESVRQELATLSGKSDDEIDYSDIPDTSDQDWSGAVRGKFLRMNSAVTYGQLTEALERLGFTASTSDAARVFTEAERDAVIVMPNGDPSGVVPKHYLSAARETVYWKSITSKHAFDKMLAEIGFALLLADRDDFIRSLEADDDPNEALVRAAQDFNQRHGKPDTPA